MSDTQGMSQPDGQPGRQPKGWLWKAIKPYTKPEMAGMLMLGFASGLPLVRSVAWFASIGGLVCMIFPLLSAA